MKNLKVFSWVYKMAFKWAKKVMFLYIGITLMGNLLPVVRMLVQKEFINQAVAIYNTKQMSISVLIFLIIFIALKYINSLFQYIDSYFAHMFIQKIKFVFNKYYLFKTYKQKQDDFFDPEFNDRHSRARNVIESIPFLILNSNEIIISLFTLVFFQLNIISQYEPYLLIYFAVVVLLKSFSSRYFSKKEFELSQKQVREKRREKYFGSLLTLKEFARELRIYQLRDYFLKKWKKSFNKLISEQRSVSVQKTKYDVLLGIVNFILENSCVLLLIYYVYLGRIDVGTFVLLYNLIGSSIKLTEDLIQNLFGSLYKDSLAIEKYINYVGNNIDDDFQKEGNYDKKLKLGKFNKLIVKNVSYKYPTADTFAVKDVSLNINKGEVISILGHNGSGKTTLSRIISGIYTPDKGQIYLNGQKISSVDKNEVYKYFGIAFQDFARYSLSLKENIGFGYIEKFEDNPIKKSLEKAGLGTFTKNLPSGLDTILGKEFDKEGQELSGGQWQKISLARAYMGEHEILILDEPTASIDPIKEMKMLEHFRSMLNNKTAILISHRIGFARLADRIIILEKGKITEQGTHEELLSLNGHYAKMFNAQKELYYEEMWGAVKDA